MEHRPLYSRWPSDWPFLWGKNVARDNCRLAVFHDHRMHLVVFLACSFEIDNLLHNSIGAGIGAVIAQRTSLGQRVKEQIVDKKKSILTFVAVVDLIIAMGFGYQGLKLQEMKRLAATNNGKNEEINMLILSPDPVYIGETDFNVSYNSDGSVLIEGTSDNRAWIEIGKVTLEAGMYSFSGLSSV